MVRTLAGILLGLAVFALAGIAQGQRLPRVGVGAFSGTRGGAARTAIHTVLSRHPYDIETISEREYNDALGRLGLEGTSENLNADARQVGRALGADFVVVGELARGGGHAGFLLRVRVLRVRGVPDSSLIGTAAWDIEGIGDITSLSLSGEIWEDLRGYLAPRQGAWQTVAEPSIGVGGASQATTGRSQAGVPPRESVGAPAPEGLSSVGGAPSAGVSSAVMPPASVAPRAQVLQPSFRGVESVTSGLGFLYLTLGGGVGMRFWRMQVLGEMATRGYEHGGFSESRGEVMVLYRLKGERLGIGLSAGGWYPLMLGANGRDENGRVIPLRTYAYEVWGGLALAYRSPAGGWARAQVGVGTQEFAIDTSRLQPEARLVNTVYTGLRLAMEGVLPLVIDPLWELGVLFGTELRVAAVGQEVRDAFGTSTGTTFGLSGMIGLALGLDAIATGLGLRVTAELLRYRTGGFSGPSSIGPGSESIDDMLHFACSITYAFGAHPPAARAPRPVSALSPGGTGL